MIRIQWETLENKDLRFFISDKERAELQTLHDEDPARFDADSTLYDLFDCVISNGYAWCEPHLVGALTDAPMLCEFIGDNGEPQGCIYGFMGYQLTSPQRELLEDGESIFTYGGYIPYQKSLDSEMKSGV
jgi:hypothetical protein